jgi:mannose-6-phosphate isomerase-like protein (cupin superfamily)
MDMMADEPRAARTTPKTRRVVTGHENGKAVVIADGVAPNVKIREAAGGLVSTLLWVTRETPANISGTADRADCEIGVAPPPGGSILRIVDFPPLAEGKRLLDNAAILREMGVAPVDAPPRSPFMHRTKSIDYAILLSGEIDMLLDDREVHLRAGDVLVQQGTNHAWENRSSETCRIAFVLIDAAPPSSTSHGGAH